jgi:four helix bundle protein
VRKGAKGAKEKAEMRKAENSKPKQKVEIGRTEMNKDRLSEEFRGRTKAFAAGVIRLFVKLPKGREEARVLSKQLLRSGTSVAAHIREASRSRSGEEFVSKLGGALQEADESALWLELLREECGIEPALTLPLEKEASELMAIFTTMINRTKEKQTADNKKQK